jgi:hypothetical protein
MTTIQANILSLIGVVVSLLVGLAVLDEETARIVVSTAGTLVSLAFSLYVELRTKTVAQASTPVKGVRR